MHADDTRALRPDEAPARQGPQGPKLLDRLRAEIRVRHYSIRTEHAYDIRTVQELLGHSDVSTTMIYTHVAGRGALGVVSPADRIELPAPEPARAAGDGESEPAAAPAAPVRPAAGLLVDEPKGSALGAWVTRVGGAAARWLRGRLSPLAAWALPYPVRVAPAGEIGADHERLR